MGIIESIILGIVEGITEFLPVSSTGHLIVVSQWLGLPQDAHTKAFEIIIQLAAILAVVTNYREKISVKYTALWIKVFIAFLPIAAIGFIFSDQIEALFSQQISAIMFIIGGVIFILVELFYYDDSKVTVHAVEDLSYKQASVIGLAQVAALIPGTSRAGSTIIGALMLRMSRKASAEFSFLLALPVMMAASGYTLLKHYDEFANENMLTLIIGFVTAYIVAALTMRLLVSFLDRFTFIGFGLYRIAFGALLLLYI